jgi:hypothetical protein
MVRSFVHNIIDHLSVPLALEGSHLSLPSWCICYRVSHCTVGVYMTKIIYILITQPCYLVFLLHYFIIIFFFFWKFSFHIELLFQMCVYGKKGDKNFRAFTYFSIYSKMKWKQNILGVKVIFHVILHCWYVDWWIC